MPIINAQQALDERHAETQRQLEAFQQRMTHDQQQLLSFLLGQISRELIEARDAAQRAYQVAAQDLAQAQQRQQQHSNQRPMDPSQARAWAREKAELAGELEVFEGILAQRQQELERAQQELQRALDRAWYAERQRALVANEAAKEAMHAKIAAAKAAFEEAKRQAIAEADQVLARLNWLDNARPDHLPLLGRGAGSFI